MIYLLIMTAMTNLNNRDICYKINSEMEHMFQLFADTYYQLEDYEECYHIELIDHESDGLHYNVHINNDYWNADEVFVALWYNIPKNLLFAYYDQRSEKVHMNLKNFYFNNKE